MSDARKSARERALRAACAVTLGLVSGCAASHTVGERDGDVPQPDSGLETDSGYVVDSGHALDAGHPIDSGLVVDAGCPPWSYDNPPPTQACCEEVGFWWEGDQCIIAVPGPFVPPAMA